MFCNKCGATLKDGVKFCSKCGSPVNQAPAEQPVNQPANQATPVEQPVNQMPQEQPMQPMQQPVQPMMPQEQPMMQQPVQPMQPMQPMQQPYMPQGQAPKKKNKLPIIIGSIAGGVLVAVIITVCILLFACGGKGASSPQEACEDLFKALSEDDFGGLEDIIYPAVFNAGYDKDVFSKDEFVDYMKNKILDFDTENVKLGSVKIIDKNIYDASEIKEVNETNKSREGYIEIEKIVSVKGNVKVKIGNADSEDRGFVIKLCYADGKWYAAGGEVKSYAYSE